jgi:hypothetical protein
MTQSMKATLISALVFPGGGHFYMKKHLVGALLAGISLICLYLLVATAVEAAEIISQKILSGEIPLDVFRIRAEIYEQSAASATGTTGIATWALAICWLVGIADSFRLGRKQEKAGHRPDSSQHG